MAINNNWVLYDNQFQVLYRCKESKPSFLKDQCNLVLWHFSSCLISKATGRAIAQNVISSFAGEEECQLPFLSPGKIVEKLFYAQNFYFCLLEISKILESFFEVIVYQINRTKYCDFNNRNSHFIFFNHKLICLNVMNEEADVLMRIFCLFV